MLNILLYVAQFETEVRSERTIAAIAKKKSRGEERKGGRPKGTHHKLTPEVLKALGQMKKDDEPVSSMARVLHLSRTTVYEGLKLIEQV